MLSRVQGGEIELFRSDYRGSYTGAFDAYLRRARRCADVPGTSRAVTDCRLFELPAADWGHAVKEWFPMAAHLLAGSQIPGLRRRGHRRPARAPGGARLGDRRA